MLESECDDPVLRSTQTIPRSIENFKYKMMKWKPKMCDGLASHSWWNRTLLVSKFYVHQDNLQFVVSTSLDCTKNHESYISVDDMEEYRLSTISQHFCHIKTEPEKKIFFYEYLSIEDHDFEEECRKSLVYFNTFVPSKWKHGLTISVGNFYKHHV